MKDKFLKVAQEGHFFDKHKKILVAVSAGRDSMCLLHCLLVNRESLQIEIAVAHVNYGLREESKLEEEFLMNFCEQLQLPFYSTIYDEPVFSEKKGRDFRYSFFKETMEHEGYTCLVTAHHADDQAETVFMRLLRGSRLQHLSGIRTVQPFGKGELIRPLLSFKKSELVTPTNYFEDSSNHSHIYLRNRVRNQYIPLLEKENPQFTRHLIELSQESQRLYQALKDLTADLDITNVAFFKKQTFAVQSFLLQLYLEKFPDLNISKSQFDELLHIIQTKANYQHSLKNDYFFVKNYEQFLVTKILPKTDVVLDDYVIESDGVFEYGAYLFSLNEKLLDATQIINVEKDVPICLRQKKNGDRILLNGFSKKVSRYFIDQKIPVDTREKVFIIEQGKKILGITNIATSDLSKSLKNDIMKSTLYIKMKE